MEIRPGYKMTEVGVIPEDWELHFFGGLFDFQNGVNADRNSYGRGVPFVNVLEALSYSHLYGPEITGRVTLSEVSRQVYSVRFGDVVFNRTSEVQEEVGLAATYMGNSAVVFGGFVIRGRPRQANLLDPTYSGYALRSKAIRSQIIPMGQGAIRANIGQENLRSVICPLPGPEDQRTIASALSAADALLDGLKRLIAKKRDLKQAAMQQLLTGKTRLPGFSDAWETRTLGELAEMASGGTPPSSIADYYDGEIPWVSIADITSRGKYIYETERNLTDAGLAASAARMFSPGTVLYAMYASLGECSIASASLCTSQAILGIKPNVSLKIEYLYYHLLQQKVAVRALGQHGTQANLNKGMVQDFKIALPSAGEQQAIAKVLCDMDTEITVLEQRLTKTRALKQAMMQELLTGRIRLVAPETSHA